MEQGCTCEVVMNNRRFSQTLFPTVLFLNCLFVILPTSSPSLCQISTIVFFDAASHMLLAESQLSLLSQSDGPGHTSGNPWQGSPLAQPPPTDWTEIFRRLFTPAETTKPIQNQNTAKEVCLSSQLSRGYTCSGSRAFQHQHSIYQLISI